MPSSPHASEHGTKHAPGWLPAGCRVYAIGDVHGCADKLRALHARIAAHLAARPIADPVLVHLGDYIDRGPESAAALAALLAPPAGLRAVNLSGNHEQMMLEAVLTAEPAAFALWMRNGGRPALRSWGLAPDLPPGELRAALPPAHLAFLRGLALSHREGGYLFVHAGVRPGVPLAAQSPHDLLWIREPFLSWPGDLGGVVVVHGHTPMEGPVVKANRIGLDTAAVLGGPLTCAVLERDRVEFLFA
jgi:serine/threonine protein phosphatase 1